MQFWKRAAAIVATALSLPAFAANLSDLWWNPQESGWGANIVQQGEKAFVTLFVYGPDGEPTWLVSPDAAVRGYSAQGLPWFEGTLYRVRGSWFGGAFDATRMTVWRHKGGANVAFFDGHCAWLRKDEIYTRDNAGKIVTNDKLWVVLE